MFHGQLRCLRKGPYERTVILYIHKSFFRGLLFTPPAATALFSFQRWNKWPFLFFYEILLDEKGILQYYI